MKNIEALFKFYTDLYKILCTITYFTSSGLLKSCELSSTPEQSRQKMAMFFFVANAVAMFFKLNRLWNLHIYVYKWFVE
uniref:Uncharacterized protein n=1 Tax=Arundo donax TaxID=35708 RepID=A0A0A9F8Q8_ARUDO